MPSRLPTIPFWIRKAPLEEKKLACLFADVITVHQAAGEQELLAIASIGIHASDQVSQLAIRLCLHQAPARGPSPPAYRRDYDRGAYDT